jgi:hypothetical protein
MKKIKKIKCAVLGKKLKKPSDWKLQLKQDLIYLYLAAESKYKKVCLTDIVSEIAQKITKTWDSAGMTILSRPRITEKVKKLLTEYRYIRDRLERGRVCSLDDFKEDSQNIFEISKCFCLCDQICSCTCGLTPDQCEFLLDQRGPRLMSTKMKCKFTFF